MRRDADDDGRAPNERLRAGGGAPLEERRMVPRTQVMATGAIDGTRT
ncbi:hypothetical protein ACODT5_23345 [Streptomyces sp. 5.8]